jgi:hypothetical protein
MAGSASGVREQAVTGVARRSRQTVWNLGIGIVFGYRERCGIEPRKVTFNRPFS